MRHILLLFVALATTLPASLMADVALPHFFSDHMVLQRQQAVAIWGSASPNAKVAVSFKGRTAAVKADAQGRWRARIATGAADAKGATLTVTSGNDSVTIKDVLVGEVWLASGQSNMVFSMNRVPAYEDLLTRADHPQIRMFNAPQVTAMEPQNDIEGEWTLCTPKTAPGYSAVAFFFARKLHSELNIPIGVIKTAWGGKPVETFTSRKALNTLPGTKALVDAAVKADASYDQAKAQAAYENRLEQWKTAVAAWREKPTDKRGRAPRRPAVPKRPLDTEGRPGVLYNSMIHPFVGYTMRGAIWYQGEGNAKPGAVPYDQTLPLLIRDWRERWSDDFSFYFVQLANFRTATIEPGDNDPWPLLQDRMRRVLDTTPKTGMAIINDVGEAKDIHPKNKKDPGERLALWALARDYGHDIVHSGPLFMASKVSKEAIRVTFKHAGAGLKSRDGGKLKRFEIAGKDRVWRWADAKVAGTDSVLVSSERVPAPVSVRYAWAANPEGANLVNSEGLPASVFRADDWDDAVQKPDLRAAENLAKRRALLALIKNLNAKREKLDRKSEEHKALTKKRSELMAQYRALSPAAIKKK